MSFNIEFSFDDIAKEIQKSTQQAVKKENEKTIRALKQATAQWKKPAEFETVETDDGATIMTEDQRYTWVDEGTKPHAILPKKSRFLRFRPGDGVRNEIARRQSMAAASDVAVYAKAVQHPGIRPRNITERVMLRREKDIVKAIEDAVEKAIG
jgi:hypothetical protein